MLEEKRFKTDQGAVNSREWFHCKPFCSCKVEGTIWCMGKSFQVVYKPFMETKLGSHKPQNHAHKESTDRPKWVPALALPGRAVDKKQNRRLVTLKVPYLSLNPLKHTTTLFIRHSPSANCKPSAARLGRPTAGNRGEPTKNTSRAGYHHINSKDTK